MSRVVFAEASTTNPTAQDSEEEKGAIAESILNRVAILDGVIQLPAGYSAASLGWGPVGADLEQVLTADSPTKQYQSVDSATGDIVPGAYTNLYNALDGDWLIERLR